MTSNRQSPLAGQDVLVFPVYSTSASSDDAYVWIQAPLVGQNLIPSASAVIDGIYVPTSDPNLVIAVEEALAAEFQAWEAASDEALTLFEKTAE